MRRSSFFIQDIPIQEAKKKFKEMNFNNILFCFSYDEQNENIIPFRVLNNIEEIFDFNPQKLEFDGLDLIVYCENRKIYVKEAKPAPQIQSKIKKVINGETILKTKTISTYFLSVRKELIRVNLVDEKSYKNSFSFRKNRIVATFFDDEKEICTIKALYRDDEIIALNKINSHRERILCFEPILDEINKQPNFETSFIDIIFLKNTQKCKISVKINLDKLAKISFTFENNILNFQISKKENPQNIPIQKIIDKLMVFLKNEIKKGDRRESQRL
ncbi:hypothetical protein [Campylobacter sp. JMF_03 NE3]|uniref:hypothetical protein n=1 Tax=Campylobacter sp. JMF_03 NE3 TaxID=2983831 RepID=UPI0022E9E412|nr:hypothetical protein [Campylobacter sp. JMF_03 NE3]MDA3053605.1 hypothetical protein [Campylobacter sp. JMF_03 NE3]